ncbi:MAG: hypothetical protein JWP02_2261 [Acidimicrobiales bacterium]|nr:hypothetical protein [Acidimicrobiales bacterium]
MSEEELVRRYLDGRMNRRNFIRKAMAAGVSAAAALAYADMLGPAQAAFGAESGQAGSGLSGGIGGGSGTGYGGSGTAGGAGGGAGGGAPG